MKQQRDALLKEKETAEKIAARAFAQSYLADLVPSVFTRLSQNGFFYNPVERGTCVCVCACLLLELAMNCLILCVCRNRVYLHALADGRS